MRVLVLFAHPVETSFSAALHTRRSSRRSTAAGHEVDDCDLYAEDFDPVLSREERLDYHDEADLHEAGAAATSTGCAPPRRWCSSSRSGTSATRRSSRASSTASSCPASRSSWSNGKARPILHNIRKLAAVTTYGGSRFRADADGRPAAQARQAPDARNRQARRAHFLSRALFDEPVDRPDARSLHAKGGGRPWTLLMRPLATMRVLVVYCHPVPESFCAAVRDAAIEALEAGGSEVQADRSLCRTLRSGDADRRAAQLQRAGARRSGARRRISSI